MKAWWICCKNYKSISPIPEGNLCLDFSIFYKACWSQLLISLYLKKIIIRKSLYRLYIPYPLYSLYWPFLLYLLIPLIYFNPCKFAVMFWLKKPNSISRWIFSGYLSTYIFQKINWRFTFSTLFYQPCFRWFLSMHWHLLWILFLRPKVQYRQISQSS